MSESGSTPAGPAVVPAGPAVVPAGLARFNRDTDTLKWVALASMVCDHANQIVLGGRHLWLTAVGRLAFPLFAYVLAYNFVHRTRRPGRLIARLLGWALASQLFYMYGLASVRSNVLFTLAFGLIYAWVFQRGQNAWVGWALAWALWTVSRFMSPIGASLEFGIEGVLLVFAWTQVLREPTRAGWASVIVFTALLNLTGRGYESAVHGAAALASLWLIARPVAERSKSKRWGGYRWLFYFFYPAHLFALRFFFGS